MTGDACARLNRELALLHDCEAKYKVPAVPIARQLIAEVKRPLPDVLPSAPPWLEFKWPMSGEVDFQGYWRAVDRGGKIDWGGPYL